MSPATGDTHHHNSYHHEPNRIPRGLPLAYTYRGDQVEGIDHGTNRGYHQHRHQGKPMCDPCQAAHTADARTRYQRRTGTARTYNVPAQCGTDGGYTAHRNRGETPCLPCKVAHSQAEAARYQRRRAGTTPKRSPNDTRHGTPGGYRKHLWLKNTPCRPCKDAHNTDATARRARKKANQ